MATMALNALVAPVRAYGKTLLATSEEPHAELLALVWGPQFDRVHAQGLLARAPTQAPHLLQTIDQAAKQFDGLADAQQQRVRQLILRHHSRWDNAGAPSPTLCNVSC